MKTASYEAIIRPFLNEIDVELWLCTWSNNPFVLPVGIVLDQKV